MAVVHRADAARAPAKLSSEILDRLPPQNLDAERALIEQAAQMQDRLSGGSFEDR